MKKEYIKPTLAMQTIIMEKALAAGSWNDTQGTGSDQLHNQGATGEGLGNSGFSIWKDDEE